MKRVYVTETSRCDQCKNVKLLSSLNLLKILLKQKDRGETLKFYGCYAKIKFYGCCIKITFLDSFLIIYIRTV